MWDGKKEPVTDGSAVYQNDYGGTNHQKVIFSIISASKRQMTELGSSHSHPMDEIAAAPIVAHIRCQNHRVHRYRQLERYQRNNAMI